MAGVIKAFGDAGLAVQDVTADGLPLPFDAAEMVNLASDMASYVPAEWRANLRPSATDDEVTAEMRQRISSKGFSSSDVAAIGDLRVLYPSMDWSPVVQGACELLAAQDNLPIGVSGALLRGVWSVQSFAKKTEVNLDELVRSGGLHHQFREALKVGNDLEMALTLVTILRFQPSLPEPPGVMESTQGHADLMAYLQSPDTHPGVITEMVKLPNRYHGFDVIFSIIDARAEATAWAAKLIQAKVEAKTIGKSLTAAELRSRWEWLKSQLPPDTFQSLVRHCFEQLVRDLIAADFDPSLANVVAYLFSMEIERPGPLLTWVSTGLKSISEDEWKAELAGNGDLLDLAIRRSTKLGLSFREGLIEHAEQLSRGEIDAPARVADWHAVMELLSADDGRLFRQRAARAAATAGGGLPGPFIEVYGAALVEDPDALHQQRILFAVLTDAVKDRHLPAMDWAVDILSSHPEFLDGEEEDYRREFTERVGSGSREEDSEEARELLERLAGLVAQPPESKSLSS